MNARERMSSGQAQPKRIGAGAIYSVNQQILRRARRVLREEREIPRPGHLSRSEALDVALAATAELVRLCDATGWEEADA